VDARRDWGRSRGYVRAMWLILQQKKSDNHVVAIGKARPVRKFCRIAFDAV